MNPLKNPLDGLVPLLGCKGTQFQADGKGNSALLPFPTRHFPPFRLSQSPLRRAKAMAKSYKTRWRRDGKAMTCPTHLQPGHDIRKHAHCKRHSPAFSNRTPQSPFKNISYSKLSRAATPQPPFTKMLGDARSGKQQPFHSKNSCFEDIQSPPDGKPSPKPPP